MDQDILMGGFEADAGSDTRHFVVAVDFGTTFSSVAYVGYTHESQRRRLGYRQVEIVDRWPDHPYGNFTCHDVPTELWYSQRKARPFSLERSALERQPLRNDASSEEEDDDDEGSDSEESARDRVVPDQHLAILSNGDSHPSSLFWGYGVQDQLKEGDYETDHLRHLTRFKLILDDSLWTAKVRDNLSPSLKTLKYMRLIEHDTDIIADYMEQLFRHTKKRLAESDGYTDASTVEFVLCVPAIWKSKASRQMQVAMGRAIANSGFGRLQNGSVDNLFLVSEPEAAAACVLASEKTRLKVHYRLRP